MKTVFEKEGVDAEIVQVGSEAVRGCIACNRCAELGKCVFDDVVNKPGDVLSEGQMVDAKITAIDEEKQKISLSIRALLTPAVEEEVEDEE